MEHIIHNSNMASERDRRVNPSSSGQRIGKRQQIDTILPDFSKAFDKVAHQRLAIKLYHYRKKVTTGLKWFTSYHILYTPPTQKAMPISMLPTNSFEDAEEMKIITDAFAKMNLLCVRVNSCWVVASYIHLRTIFSF